MFQDSPMTTAEEAANLAWQDYADAHQAVRTAWETPGITSSNRRALHERMLDAGKRFQAAYDLLGQPTPTDLERERSWLACEGVALVSLLAAFVGLFLPDLIALFWPLAVTFVAVGALGGWTVLFLGRLGQHLRRRM